MRTLTWWTLVVALVVAPCAAVAQRSPQDAGKTDMLAAPRAGTYAYVERFDGTDPAAVFDGLLTVGHDAPWTGTLTGEHYRLENLSSPGAARYFYLMALPGSGAGAALSQGTVQVDVSIAETHPGAIVVGAGLVFDVDPELGHYLAFIATDEGYALFVRDSDGLNEAMSGTTGAVAPGAWNRLAVRTSGSETVLEINGETIGSIDFGHPPAGGIGIVALGAGTFAFTDFAYASP
jgi:hypothetical protein